MEIQMYRFSTGENNTLGIMLLDGQFECFTLEDEKRTVKVAGQTRIDAGRYEIRFREILSGKTKSYRRRYDWFTWHLHLQDVPNFKYVYIHVGNYERDTEGCILVGNQSVTNRPGNRGAILASRIAFKILYLVVSKKLKAGEPVFIEIKNHII